MRIKKNFNRFFIYVILALLLLVSFNSNIQPIFAETVCHYGAFDETNAECKIDVGVDPEEGVGLSEEIKNLEIDFQEGTFTLPTSFKISTKLNWDAITQEHIDKIEEETGVKNGYNGSTYYTSYQLGVLVDVYHSGGKKAKLRPHPNASHLGIYFKGNFLNDNGSHTDNRAASFPIDGNGETWEKTETTVAVNPEYSDGEISEDRVINFDGEEEPYLKITFVVWAFTVSGFWAQYSDLTAEGNFTVNTMGLGEATGDVIKSPLINFEVKNQDGDYIEMPSGAGEIPGDFQTDINIKFEHDANKFEGYVLSYAGPGDYSDYTELKTWDSSDLSASDTTLGYNGFTNFNYNEKIVFKLRGDPKPEIAQVAEPTTRAITVYDDSDPDGARVEVGEQIQGVGTKPPIFTYGDGDCPFKGGFAKYTLCPLFEGIINAFFYLLEFSIEHILLKAINAG